MPARFRVGITTETSGWLPPPGCTGSASLTAGAVLDAPAVVEDDRGSLHQLRDRALAGGRHLAGDPEDAEPLPGDDRADAAFGENAAMELVGPRQQRQRLEPALDPAASLEDVGNLAVDEHRGEAERP